MELELDRDRDKQSSTEKASTDAPAPGRRSASAALSGRELTIPSGILMRKGSGGVEVGAEDAVARASSSGGQALPDELRTKFEGSLGTDLSSVRIHTGTESQEAAASVSAKAYAIGNDVHFAAGQYDPSSQAGQHLLAHEVAHTVQQRGGTPVRQNKLEVSSASDSFEREADQAASAMVGGSAFSLASAPQVIARGEEKETKDNEVVNKDGLKWGCGTALLEDEAKQWYSEKSKVVSVASSWLGEALGWQGLGGGVVAKLRKDATERHTTDIELRGQELAFIESEIEYLDGLDRRDTRQRAKLDEYELRHKQLKGEYDRLKGSSALADALTSANGVAGTINSFAGKALGTAAMASAQSGALSPSLFKKGEDWSGTLGKIISGIDVGIKLLDRTAINNFQSDPCFETAEAWGRHMGGIFNGLGAFAGGLPGGWGVVIQGVLAMPAIVTANFADLVRSHYKKIDEMTRDPGAGNSRILEEGTSG